MRANRFQLLLILLFICESCHAQADPRWTTSLAPFQIADNLYYVGSEDLASYLVVTPEGNILINANLATSPTQIRESVEKFGFRWLDIKILLNSQAHQDHMGGAAEVVRQTHAKNMVMDGDVAVVETGGQADFIASSAGLRRYARVHVDRVLHDQDVVSLGGVTLTAYKTAGHTRGCTTWTLRSHIPGEPAGKVRNIVIIGGVSFWSEYRFVDSSHRPASYPGIAEDFRRTFALLHRLPCDVFLGAHGDYFDLLTKLRSYPQQGPRVLIDPAGYDSFVTTAQRQFERAVKEQQGRQSG